MAENTKIQWCHHTFNPWIGCTKVAEGCKSCYAETMMDHRYGRVKWGPQGTRSRTKTWRDPLRWNREAEAAGERRKVFCASLADVFEDFNGPLVTSKSAPLWRDKRGRYDDGEASGFDPYEIATLDHLRSDLFDLIDRTPNLYWLLLTKRPENIARMWPETFPTLRENVWLGTSIANQNNADENIDTLAGLRHLADKLFLSVEPQIGYVNLDRWIKPAPFIDSLIDWVIVGGESKQGPAEPRRFDIRWAMDMLYDCDQAKVPCFIKQFGSNVYEGHRRLTFKDSHGGNMNEWPERLRVRQCPETFQRV